MAIIGRDLSSDNPIDISGNARRSGLYIVGKPGMGKSTLIVGELGKEHNRPHHVPLFDPPRSRVSWCAITR